MNLMKDQPPHTWHMHFSFGPRRKYSWWSLCSDHHRAEAQRYRGHHGMVKTHRDAMRHFAKLEAKGL